MSAAPFAVFAMFCFSVCATAQMRTLEVYPGEAAGLDSATQEAMETELKRILAPAGIDLIWKTQADGSAEIHETQSRVPLVVGAFSGNCAVDSLPASFSPDSRVLAETSIADSRILPYFRVDCSRISRSLGPTLERLSVPFRAVIFGRALGRVIAHEIYHILSQTRDHEDSGIAKARFSVKELMSEKLDLNPASLRRMQASLSLPGLRTPEGVLASLHSRSR